tara:strand:+ start:712 stop:984 length:273 start_codon:yes stop_codon:yes gene_type:complete
MLNTVYPTINVIGIKTIVKDDHMYYLIMRYHSFNPDYLRLILTKSLINDCPNNKNSKNNLSNLNNKYNKNNKNNKNNFYNRNRYTVNNKK